MINIKRETIQPRRIRIDASTACQLKCPSCPTASGETGKRIGVGFLSFEDFKSMIDRHPEVAHIELTNWGEIFLNKQLDRIIKYAYQKNVALYAANGVNLNNVSEEMLETLVKYKFRELTCSIDGFTQDVYEQYRVRGNIGTVLENIRAINRLKKKHRSPFPKLRWQYIAFSHNIHEIPQARALAKELDMEFFLKLEWGDLYDTPSFPAQHNDILRKEACNGITSRKEYEEVYGLSYEARECCIEMWTNPQVNFNGKVLGCPVNFWGDYGNAFTETGESFYNSEGMMAAREMLMGKRPAVKGLPCTVCKVYKKMRDTEQWITDTEIGSGYEKSRAMVFLEHKLLGYALTRRLSNAWYELKRRLDMFRMVVGRKGGGMKAFGAFCPWIKDVGDFLSGRAVPIEMPMRLGPDEAWKPQFLFRGFSLALDELTCHVSALKQGHSPHPPHKHVDEEILIMLAGEAELDLPEAEEPHTLKPGEFVYYPSNYPHTLRTTSDDPAHYLMFKWNNPLKEHQKKLRFGRFDAGQALQNSGEQAGMSSTILFDGKTDCLEKLHAHISSLAPGAGYAPHTDNYDVALVILEGEVETLGRKVGRHEVVFYPAGEAHGLRNRSETTAKYIVFEFHG